MKSVYCFQQDGSDILKIGISATPDKRAVSLNNGRISGFKVEYSELLFNPMIIERRIHNVLFKYSIGKEWFRYPFKKAKLIVYNMVLDYENIKPKKKQERLLKKELRLLGMSQTKAADKLGVTRVTINNWISGRIFIPPEMVVELQKMGITKKAVTTPDLLV